ncbi:MAG: CocE/NonD family hydrolase, partial [Pseudomonadota bacterium]
MARYLWLIVLTALMLTACGGGSSSGSGDDSAARSQQPVTSDSDTPADDEDDPIVGDETDSPEPPAGAYTRPLDYRYMVTLPLQFLPTADGRLLGVRVTLPANERRKPAEGPFPAILVQTAYNMHLIGAVPMTGGALLGAPDPFMVKRGYAEVAVDTLGTGVSQGGWEMLGEDEQKAYGDTVDWVKQQPWFNGKLGVAGASYMAITSLFTAQRRPDDV